MHAPFALSPMPEMTCLLEHPILSTVDARGGLVGVMLDLLAN